MQVPIFAILTLCLLQTAAGFSIDDAQLFDSDEEQPELFSDTNDDQPELFFDTNDDQPGLKLRITRQGLDYANQIASNILNSKVRQARIPPIHADHIKVWNIRITGFAPPTYFYGLTPPSTLSWGFNGAAINLEATVQAWKKFIFKVTKTVEVTVQASGVNAVMSARFGRTADGHPVIVAADCRTSIGYLKVKIISGGFIAWVMSLFEDKISKSLKSMAEAKVSELARNFLLNDVNAKLATFPVHTMLGKHFDLDYGLAVDPAMTPQYMEIAVKGKVTLEGSTAGSPYSPTPLASTTAAPKMMFIWLSDKIFNDLAYFGHIGALTRTHVRPQDPDIGPYLKLHCDPGTVCIGSLLPELIKVFPPGTQAADMGLNTTTPPFLRLASDGTATLSMNGTSELYTMISPAQKLSAVVAAVTVQAQLSVSIQNLRLVGHVTIPELKVHVLQSKLSPESVKMLETVFPTIGKPILERKINDVLETGLPIPVTKGIALRNPQVRILDRTLQLESDVGYGSSYRRMKVAKPKGYHYVTYTKCYHSDDQFTCIVRGKANNDQPYFQGIAAAGEALEINNDE